MDFIEVNKYIDELRLSGHTWEEVNDICNKKYGKTRNKDTWRKPYEAWKATVNDILNDTDNELFEREIERIARAKTRLDINRQVLNAQQTIINDEVRKESKYELFNEEVQKTLLKVQGAMAFAQGLEGLDAAKKQFITLGQDAVKAFNADTSVAKLPVSKLSTNVSIVCVL